MSAPDQSRPSANPQLCDHQMAAGHSQVQSLLPELDSRPLEDVSALEHEHEKIH